MRWTLLLVLLSIGVTGPLTAQLPSGCLDLAEVGPWYRVDTLDVATTEPLDDAVFSIPARVELIDSAFPIDSQANVLSVPENSQQTPHGMLSWKFDGHVLELVLSTGFSGVHATVQRDGFVWSGTLRTFVDYSPAQLHERRVTLAAADCSSPPPILSSEDPPLPRGVALASGARIALGLPIPPDVSTEERRSDAFAVLDEPAGEFAAASRVVAYLNGSGVVHRIGVRFDQAADADRLAREIDAAFGQPVRPSTSVAWAFRNRTTTILIGRPDAAGSVQVTLLDPRIRFAP